MNRYWPEFSNGIIVKISVIWSRCFFANCWNKECTDPYPKFSTSYQGSGWQDTLFLLEKMTWWQGRGCLNTCQKFDATRPKPAHGRYGLGWDRGARTQLKVLIFRYRHFFVTNVHTSYLSQTPQTCLCKKFLSGVNFSRMNEKNAHIWLFQRHF